MDEALRYPVGRFRPTDRLTGDERRDAIETMRQAPARLRAAVTGLSDAQLDTPYREGGWTLRQVVHHVPDSHLNGYVRTKWALTEDGPTLKAYDQAAWAELPDSRGAVEPSLDLLDAVHARWLLLVDGLDEEAFARGIGHPEFGPLTVDGLLSLYAWHGRHHTAHVTSLRDRRGW